MPNTITTIGRRFAAHASVATADAVGAAERFVGQRHRALGDGERGAQAAEYAMLGGVSAAACTALVTIFKNKSTLATIVESVVNALGKVIEGWF